ncbi:CinA family protein [Defluviicoccus vanus]|uniref:CinA family protein n=1 Tax=Defluviicoccus vanus TaxID=111831 RepID=A0A7H1MXR8_9PROT|nr:CinA family protein [Defluviicoccus vanus]QNT68254.1 CinA family protein [Defluviicoccus vanus]
MFDATDLAEAEAILERCRRQRIKLATAESCTGGLIGALLTAIPGSSDVFERGFITYSNEAKTALLDVSAELLRREGAVNEAVARAMAEGALARSQAQLVVAVTGIAGPGGGSAARPVGLVYMAATMRGMDTVAERHLFAGDRTGVRIATVRSACKLLLTILARSAA